MNEQLRAWEVSAYGIGGIVLATRRTRAIQIALLSAKDAGFSYTYIDFRCKRSPKHDPLHHIVKPGQYIICDLADQMLTVSAGEAAKLARA